MTAEAETPAERKRRFTFVGSLDWLIGIVIAAIVLCAYVAGTYGTPFVLLMFFIVPVSLFLKTLIHEAGHALAAFACGWRVIVFAVWPSAWHFPNRRLVIDANISTSDGGGFIATVPSRLSHNTVLRWAIILLGGPLASLAAGVGLLTLAIMAPETWFDRGDLSGSNDTYRVFFGITLGFGALCLGSFFGTIIPRTYSSGDTSDGAKLVEYFKSRRIPVVTWISLMLHYNVRLRDVPVWMYEAARAESLQLESNSSWHDSVDVSRTLDADKVDVARAREFIDRYRLLHGENDWLLACETYLAAVYENDLLKAEACIARMSKMADEAALTQAVKAAVAARRGDRKLVARKLDHMESILIRQTPFPNPTFDDIRRQIQAIAEATPPAEPQLVQAVAT